MKKQGIALTALSFALLAPAFGEIQDDDIYVCRDSRYKKIQEGVNAARPGSRIHVCAGTYAEQVTVAVDGITVQAEGRAIVIEPTPAQAYGFRILGQNVNIQGFNITGFKDRTLSAGILLDHARGAVISGNKVYGNCNGVLLNQSPGASIAGNNLSQNPYPISPVAQPGIPEPPAGQTPANSCVVFAFDPITQAAIVSADGYGLKSVASREQIVKENTVSQNGECGIQLSGDSAGSTVSGNTLFFNTGQQFTPCGNIDLRSVSGRDEV
nr:right-handed parallel beta-helix repeat-containing protein [Acidobacteriota bacterium]